MDRTTLLYILDSIQTQIRFFDMKAQLVLATDGVLAGFLGLQTPRVAAAIRSEHWSASTFPLLVTFAGCCAMLLFSLYQGFRTVRPRVKLSQPESRIFFDHIAKQYGSDYSRIAEEYLRIPDEELQRDAATQILATSKLCSAKLHDLTLAADYLLVALLFWLATLLFLLGIN